MSPLLFNMPYSVVTVIRTPAGPSPSVVIVWLRYVSLSSHGVGCQYVSLPHEYHWRTLGMLTPSYGHCCSTYMKTSIICRAAIIVIDYCRCLYRESPRMAVLLRHVSALIRGAWSISWRHTYVMMLLFHNGAHRCLLSEREWRRDAG